MNPYVQRATSPKIPKKRLRQMHQAIAANPIVLLGKAGVFLLQVGQNEPSFFLLLFDRLMTIGPPPICWGGGGGGA